MKDNTAYNVIKGLRYDHDMDFWWKSLYISSIILVVGSASVTINPYFVFFALLGYAACMFSLFKLAMIWNHRRDCIEKIQKNESKVD